MKWIDTGKGLYLLDKFTAIKFEVKDDLEGGIVLIVEEQNKEPYTLEEYELHTLTDIAERNGIDLNNLVYINGEALVIDMVLSYLGIKLGDFIDNNKKRFNIVSSIMEAIEIEWLKLDTGAEQLI